MTKIGRKVHTSFNQHEGSGDHLFRSGCGLESSACDFPASTSPRDFLAWPTGATCLLTFLCAGIGTPGHCDTGAPA
jgi:hypothetical protein